MSQLKSDNHQTTAHASPPKRRGRKARVQSSPTVVKPSPATIIGGADHQRTESHSFRVRAAVSELREAQALRKMTMNMQRRIDNAARALVRRSLGWRMDLPQKERTAINKEAERMVAAIQGARMLRDTQARPALSIVAPFVLASAQAREPYDTIRKSTEKRMVELAKSLPPWPWVDAVRGFGAMSLAIIVGECGDLSEYRSPAGVWKRLGLAPKECYAMETKAGMTAHAIPRARRSAMWTIGDCLIKTNKDGEYRTIYLEHKALQTPRVKTKMHAHRRAQRYMEKRLIRDLWRAWRATMTLLPTMSQAHPASALEAAA